MQIDSENTLPVTSITIYNVPDAAIYLFNDRDLFEVNLGWESNLC